ncbi:uncharacterized protein LOC130501291 [Raphanus sativus]|uniref:Uncharacterized protein LOC130501291 n=1 Tax=Raphanus sativus TaxID=3726 RepID=A0A9W3CL31_RAPSA|nr:uncharacterized protein LOC130501291 [Raphanus sativus]
MSDLFHCYVSINKDLKAILQYFFPPPLILLLYIALCLNLNPPQNQNYSKEATSIAMKSTAKSQLSIGKSPVAVYFSAISLGPADSSLMNSFITSSFAPTYLPHLKEHLRRSESAVGESPQ